MGTAAHICSANKGQLSRLKQAWRGQAHLSSQCHPLNPSFPGSLPNLQGPSLLQGANGFEKQSLPWEPRRSAWASPGAVSSSCLGGPQQTASPSLSWSQDGNRKTLASQSVVMSSFWRNTQYPLPIGPVPSKLQLAGAPSLMLVLQKPTLSESLGRGLGEQSVGLAPPLLSAFVPGCCPQSVPVSTGSVEVTMAISPAVCPFMMALLKVVLCPSGPGKHSPQLSPAPVRCTLQGSYPYNAHAFLDSL